MMQLRYILSAMTVLGLVGIVQADEKTVPLKGIMCPVSGHQVTDQAIEYRGAKLYFCCEDCISTYQQDPQQYAAKANFQLVATEQAKQVACVFCQKEKLNPETELIVDGVKIQFGCFGCMQQVKDAEDKVEAAFNDEQFENGFQIKSADAVE